MPKERVHLIIARRTLRELPEDCLLKNGLEKYRNLYLLGSVVPDSFAYYPGKIHNRFRKSFQEFHRKAESGGFPIGGLIADARELPDPALLAFLSGVITHIITDRAFHPAVRYFAGGDITRHYQLEAYLDLYVEARMAEPDIPVVQALLQKLEVPRSRLLAMTESLFQIDPRHRRGISRALLWHGRIQKRFTRPGISRFLRIVNPLLFFRLAPLLALCYPRISDPRFLFRGNLEFYHPGARKILPLDWIQIAREAVRTQVRILLGVQNNMKDSNRLADFFSRKAERLLPAGWQGPGGGTLLFDTSRNIKQLAEGD